MRGILLLSLLREWQLQVLFRFVVVQVHCSSAKTSENASQLLKPAAPHICIIYIDIRSIHMAVSKNGASGIHERAHV